MFFLFWPPVFDRLGIFCLSRFCVNPLSFFYFVKAIKKRTDFSEIKGLFEGLSVFIIMICIYTFGSGFNVPAVIFTYCALAGMGIGVVAYSPKQL